MEPDRETIAAMAAAKITFVYHVGYPMGRDIYLEPDEVITFLKDRDAGIARHLGVSKADYLAWVEVGGVALCGAKTTKGKPCKNLLSLPIMLSINEWLRVHRQEYCAVHGGQPSHKEGR